MKICISDICLICYYLDMSRKSLKLFVPLVLFGFLVLFPNRSLAVMCSTEDFSCGAGGQCATDEICACRMACGCIEADYCKASNCISYGQSGASGCSTTGQLGANCCTGLYCDTSVSPYTCTCGGETGACSATMPCCPPNYCDIGGSDTCVNSAHCKDAGEETTNPAICCSRVDCDDNGAAPGGKNVCCADGESCGTAGCYTPYENCVDEGGECDYSFLHCCSGYCDDDTWTCKPDSEYVEPKSILYNGPVISDLNQIIGPIARILYYGGLFIGIFFVILSGYKLMTSAGNPQSTQDAQEQLTAAILGIIFILLSAVILRVIINDIIGGGIKI